MIMEKLKMAVNEIAYARKAPLSPLHHCLIPFLFVSSSFYKFTSSFRRFLYQNHVFRTHRVGIPVISVGSLTSGGSGKTPMVDFITSWIADSGPAGPFPIILSRCGRDEVKTLRRHLHGTTSFATGQNWVRILSLFPLDSAFKVAVLHDAMQYWRFGRDLDIVMVNGLTLWGNRQLWPLGPLREPLTALRRADVVVIHHADLVSEHILKDIESMVQRIKVSVPIFLTKMDPTYLFKVGDINDKIPITALHNATILCVSAIGSAEPFVKTIEKMGALYVDQVEFSDHHKFHARDIEMIRNRLPKLEFKFGSRPIVVVTEKDYDRDPKILEQLYPFKVFVLCSTLKVVPYRGGTEESFKKFIKDKLTLELPAAI